MTVRRTVRIIGTLLIAAGALTLLWAFVVWQWQDPFTALYTKWKQHELAGQYDKRVAAFRPRPISNVSLAAERRAIAAEAKQYRKQSATGAAIGRIRVPRMHLNMILVNGTDHETLKKGPGRDLRTFMPGENRLVYIAGHRTTYLAPFSHIDQMRKGDAITIEVPYATFTYRMSGARIVPADDLAVLRSPRHEVVELQACHPRFFATHRYIVYGQLTHVAPRGGTPYDTGREATAQAQPSGR
jgi:sortase A